jgi:transcriptional regulator with XRE-family HTH domain
MTRYREARIRAGISQKAAAISLGVRAPSMSDWESGKTKPTHEHLVAMAALYNTTTDFLTGASETEKKQPAVHDSELLNSVISRIQDLPDPALSRVSDFLDGLRAGREVAAEQAAAPDPDGAPAV